MPINRLAKHRDAERFRSELFAIISLLEHWVERLNDDTLEWSSADLATMTLRGPYGRLEAFLSSQERLEHLVDAHPHEACELIQAAVDLLPALWRIREARWGILQHYTDGAGGLYQDVLEPRHAFTLKDRGAFRGLTESQQANYEAQLCRLGHLRITKTDRMQLRDAIRRELGLLHTVQS